MTALWDQTGIKPSELDSEPPSSAVGYLLGYFYELSAARQAGMALNAILFSEILAWSQLKQIPLSGWEIDVIKRLDLLWLKIQSEE